MCVCERSESVCVRKRKGKSVYKRRKSVCERGERECKKERGKNVCAR